MLQEIKLPCRRKNIFKQQHQRELVKYTRRLELCAILIFLIPIASALTMNVSGDVTLSLNNSPVPTGDSMASKVADTTPDVQHSTIAYAEMVFVALMGIGISIYIIRR